MTVDINDVNECKKLWEQHENYDQILHYLRSKGYAQIDSIKTVVTVCGLSLGEAKRILHFSSVWQDEKEATDKLHDTIENVLKDYEGAENGTNNPYENS